MRQKIAFVMLAMGLSFSLTVMADVDVDAAKALARQNNCFKCHAHQAAPTTAVLRCMRALSPGRSATSSRYARISGCAE